MLLDRLSDMAGLNSSITRGDGNDNGNANGNQINQQSDKFLNMILFLIGVDEKFAILFYRSKQDTDVWKQQPKPNDDTYQYNLTNYHIKSDTIVTQEYMINVTEKIYNWPDNIFMIDILFSTDNQPENIFKIQHQILISNDILINAYHACRKMITNITSSQCDNNSSPNNSHKIYKCIDYDKTGNCNNTVHINIKYMETCTNKYYNVILNNADKIKEQIIAYIKDKMRPDILFFVLDNVKKSFII